MVASGNIMRLVYIRFKRQMTSRMGISVSMDVNV